MHPTTTPMSTASATLSADRRHHRHPFLLVTHHRITMAHVDRLFGVTMAERGASQLVSVDLARAVRLRQTG